MSTEAALRTRRLTPFEQLRYAREIIQIEAQALVRVADRMSGDLPHAVDYLYGCKGNSIVTGMGKAGIIGQKIAATLASTGTRSHFLHPAEAIHGDLGRVHRDDVVVILSKSGETAEIINLLPAFEKLPVPTIAVTSRRDSTLGRAASVTLELGPLDEACSLGLAPSTSTTAMLAVGDALALVTSRLRNFGPEDFARFHPGGNLGRHLARVDDIMRPREECRIARDGLSVRDVFVQLGQPGRRSGAIMLVDEADALTGLFTDSDLARLFESRRDESLDRRISEVMTPDPRRVTCGAMLTDAVAIMADRRISELPVVDARGTPIGLIDITDVVGMLPETNN